jgi:hypothetical protein
MDRHASRLIDDDHILVLVHDAYGLRSDRRLVSM